MRLKNQLFLQTATLRNEMDRQEAGGYWPISLFDGQTQGSR